jgi:23S rRNA pseudouridine1911/1915/1917 synthase
MGINTPSAKSAITIIENIAFKEPFSLVRCRLITGRTHQIRVHLASQGFPIVGDSLYGSIAINEKYGESTQLLHAHKLEFTHPITKKIVSITAPPPPKINKFLKNHFDL